MLPMDISSLEKSVAALERAANFLAETHPNNPMHEQVRGNTVQCFEVALVSDPPMGWGELEDLRDIFSASNLPMRTDLVTLDSLPPLVRRNVEAEHVVLRRVNPADIAAAEND